MTGKPDDMDDVLRNILREMGGAKPKKADEKVSEIGDLGMLVERHEDVDMSTPEKKMAAMNAAINDLRIAGHALALAFTAFGLIEEALRDMDQIIADSPKGNQRVRMIEEAAKIAGQSAKLVGDMETVKITIRQVDHKAGETLEDTIKRMKLDEAAEENENDE